MIMMINLPLSLSDPSPVPPCTKGQGWSCRDSLVLAGQASNPEQHALNEVLGEKWQQKQPQARQILKKGANLCNF